MSVRKEGCISTSGKDTGLNCKPDVVGFGDGLGQTVTETDFCPDMSKVINGAWACFLAQHVNHVNGILLLWKVCARCCGNEVVSICADVDVCLLRTNVHPKTTQHLTCSETFHQRVELRNGGGQSGSVDFMRFKFNQGTFGVLLLVSWFSKKDSLSTLRAGVWIVSVCCVGIAYNAKLPLQRPKTKVCWFKFDSPDKFVESLYVTDGRWSCARSATRKGITKGILCTWLQPINLTKNASIRSMQRWRARCAITKTLVKGYFCKFIYA